MKISENKNGGNHKQDTYSRKPRESTYVVVRPTGRSNFGRYVRLQAAQFSTWLGEPLGLLFRSPIRRNCGVLIFIELDHRAYEPIPQAGASLNVAWRFCRVAKSSAQPVRSRVQPVFEIHEGAVRPQL